MLWMRLLHCMCVCCEGDGNAGVVSGGGVVVVSAYMGGTRVIQVFCLVQVTC